MDEALPLEDLRAKLRQNFDKLEKHLKAVGGALRVESSPVGELVSSALLKSNAQLLALAAEQLLGDLDALQLFAAQAAALAVAQASSTELDPLLQHNSAQLQEALAHLSAENIS